MDDDPKPSDQRPENIECAKSKLKDFFVQFLSTPQTQLQVNSFMEMKARSVGSLSPCDSHHATPQQDLLSQLQNVDEFEALSPTRHHNHNDAPKSPFVKHAQPVAFHNAPKSSLQIRTPPKSPKSRRERQLLSPTEDRRSVKKKLQLEFDKQNVDLFPISEQREYVTIPQFYFPRVPQGKDEIRKEIMRIKELFSRTYEGFSVSEFDGILDEYCNLPYFFTTLVFRKIDTSKSSIVTERGFEEFWKRDMQGKTLVERYFYAIKKPQNDYIESSDFDLIMQDLLHLHPGLEFLKQTPLFQSKYCEAVVARIFYTVNRSGTGRITLRELEKSKLIDAFQFIATNDDINKELYFFSYEHFYVLYCKFWELDTDHDFLISKTELQPYGNYGISLTIINRVFQGYAKPKSPTCPQNAMDFTEFVWFCISEEDKTTPTALEYWFRCVDLDGDGGIGMFDLEHFIKEQMDHLKMEGMENVPFQHLFSQILDMLKPKNPWRITLADVKRTPRVSEAFFNVLFNPTKFLLFEQKGFGFNNRLQQSDDASTSQWCRFAEMEYRRMAAEEEEDEIMTNELGQLINE